MAEVGWDLARRSLQMAAMAMGSMAAIVTAWLAMGLPTLATREWVNDQIAILKAADNRMLDTVRSIQLDVLVSRRDLHPGTAGHPRIALCPGAGIEEGSV